MVATVMRDSTLMVKNQLPAADQIQKLDKKDRVMYIYAGEPLIVMQTNTGHNPVFSLMINLPPFPKWVHLSYQNASNVRNCKMY